MVHRIHGTGISTNIYHKNQLNVGKYTIHGWYGWDILNIKWLAGFLPSTVGNHRVRPLLVLEVVARGRPWTNLLKIAG